MTLLPPEYVLTRATFDALAETVAARLPVNPDSRTHVLDRWKHYRTPDGRPGECLAIQCAHEWTGYAAFAVAQAILTAEQPGSPTPADFDSMMFDLGTRQATWNAKWDSICTYWPTITVVAE